MAGFAFDSDTRFFYLIWALVAVALILVANFVRSNRGRILRAMHGDQAGARSLGLHITRAKISVFVISACLASIAGSLYASYFRYLSPDQVGSAESLQLITMLVIGGMGTLFGPLIGVDAADLPAAGVPAIANYSMLVTGVLLVRSCGTCPPGSGAACWRWWRAARARGPAAAARDPGSRTERRRRPPTAGESPRARPRRQPAGRGSGCPVAPEGGTSGTPALDVRG